MRLDRKFYSQDTVHVAKQLLGKTLVRKIGKVTISGIITETEAYRQSDDPASHAYRGITQRNHAMFGDVGHAYVYFTYGMYHCVNVVARNNRHSAGAVLIRALLPRTGIDTMMKLRSTDDVDNLTSGPGKLTIALDITKKQYGEDLVNSKSLYITDGIPVSKIKSSPRIGIRVGVEKKWNFRF
ncbi:MAG: DNA-3-methyladenine glycosylase [Thaumarchaeota archaeon]|nr:DNA-3-methyladenine glycosylase [Nitrososphaerota archaeon]